MLVTLWILNGLLALVFLGAGGMKLARPREALAANGMGWATDFAGSTVKLIGALEVIGAIGLILPRLLGVAPVLTPLAAVGLAVTMIVASVVHVRRSESPATPAVLAVLALASAVLGFLTL